MSDIPAQPKSPWIERIRKMQRGELPAPPIARLLNMMVVQVEEGLAVLEMETDESYANPLGSLHGGIFCDLGDAAMGYAMSTTVGEGESFTTIELKANFFKPVWKSRLRATARIVRRSRTIGYSECDITDPQGSLVCRMGSTLMLLRGEAARGR